MAALTEKKPLNNTILSVVLASIGIIISSFIIGSAIKAARAGDHYISVKGYAERDIVADLAIWTSQISVEAATLQEAYDKLQSDMEKVLSYFISKGISKDDIQTEAVNSETTYRYDAFGNVVGKIGFHLSQQITIGLKDVNKIYTLSRESSELIRQGINFASFDPNYYYTQLDALKIKMLGEASRDARKRASTLAKNTQCTVGALKSAYQGVFQITSQNSTETSDYGTYNTSAMYKTIKSVVTMEFYIQ